MLRHPPLPGYPGSDRYAELAGELRDGKQIGPIPQIETLERVRTRARGKCND